MSSTEKSLPSAFALFETSKQLVLKNIKAFLIIIALPSLLLSLGEIFNGDDPKGGFATTQTTEDGSPLGALFKAAGFILTLLFLGATYVLLLESSQGKMVDAKDAIKRGLNYFWRILGLGIVMSLIIFVGLLLLIVPGIIAIQRLFFAPYFLVHDNLSISDAIKRSSELGKGNAGPIWGVIGVFILLAFLNVVPLIGQFLFLAGYILYSVAPALRFFQLRKATPAKAAA